MVDVLFLSLAILLVVGGFGLMAYGLVSVARDNYKPRHTRSTYIPLRKKR
jgi:hypothetical protein